jgi:hypothetical protein
MPISTSYSFDTNSLEWVLNLTVPQVKGASRHILLKRVWITSEALNEHVEANGPLTKEAVLDIMSSTLDGGKYVRTILPSEVGDFHRPEAAAEDILNRHNNSDGLHKPVTGYYFYVDFSMTMGFLNYDLMATCITAVEAAFKSHTGGYAVTRSSANLPVNSTVYSTYPVRLVVGEKQVVGAKAGDMIRYSSTGGSGEYTVSISDPSSLIQEMRGLVRIVKNVSGTAIVRIHDKNNMESAPSEISITVEKVL